MEFNGSLGTYKLINTEDGSVTLHSQYFGENCHSTSGAWQETLHNYINGTQVLEKLANLKEQGSNKQLTIFEVGFGLATGLHCTIKESLNSEYTHPIEFISTELDREFALWSLTQSPLAKEYSLNAEMIKKTRVNNDLELFEVHIEHVHLKLLIGDARRTVLHLNSITKNKLDCIFQDAFSSGKNPTLWTIEWFKVLQGHASSNAILATYSAAVSVRKTLKEAGFQVEQAKGFGQKRSMTICFNTDEQDDSTQLHQLLGRTKAKVLSDN